MASSTPTAVCGAPLRASARRRRRCSTTPLDLLDRWWWRVDVIGRERLPAPRSGAASSRTAARRPAALRGVAGARVALGAAGSRGAAPAARRLAARSCRSSARPLRRSAPSPRRAVAAPRARRRRGRRSCFPEGHGRGRQVPARSATALAPFRDAPRWCASRSRPACPVVPVAVIGAEEAQPVLWRSDCLGRLARPACRARSPPPFVPAADQVDDPRRRAARPPPARCRSAPACAGSTCRRARAAPGPGERRVVRRRRASSSERAAMRFVVAIDQGTTGHDRARARPPRPCRRARLPRVHAALPEARLGRARSRGDLARHARRAAAGVPARRRARPRHRRRSASRTSARRRSCGTGGPAGPSTAPSSGRTGAPPTRCDALRAAGAEDLVRAQDGSGARSVLQRARSSRWLLGARAPGAGARRARASCASAPSTSWLVWKLTGGAVHVTDPTNASRTLLYDIHAPRWDHELLPALRGAATPCCRRCDRRAACSARPPRDVLGAPVPIAGIAGDQQAALFGQGCTAPGMAKNTYGTGCFLLLHTGERPVGLRARAAHHASRATREAARPTRSRARSSSPAPRSSGCATGSACSKTRGRVGAACA